MMQQRLDRRLVTGPIVDIRGDAVCQGEPFLRVLDVARATPPGGAFVLVAPFEPRALYAVLAERGFSYATEHVGMDEWMTRFVREA